MDGSYGNQVQKPKIVPFTALNLQTRPAFSNGTLVELLLKLMIPDICSLFPYSFSFPRSSFIYFFPEGKESIHSLLIHTGFILLSYIHNLNTQ